MGGSWTGPAPAPAGSATTAFATTRPTRVVIADDQDLIRAACGWWIDRAPGLTVVGEAATGHDAVRGRARGTRPTSS